MRCTRWKYRWRHQGLDPWPSSSCRAAGDYSDAGGVVGMIGGERYGLISDPRHTHSRLRRSSYFDLHDALENIQCNETDYQYAYNLITQFGMQKARLFFIGNGGSAAVASHMATDWAKNGGFATFGPGDVSMMSCYGNDYGFESVYSEIIERHGMLGDVLFAISSSGMSENILRAVDVAKEKRMNVITLSGFGEGNFLR